MVLSRSGLCAAGKKKGKEVEEEESAPWMDRLMDVMLSLLSIPAGALPSAPLRDAVETLFRTCAGHLTSAGAITGTLLICRNKH